MLLSFGRSGHNRLHNAHVLQHLEQAAGLPDPYILEVPGCFFQHADASDVSGEWFSFRQCVILKRWFLLFVTQRLGIDIRALCF
jgi:hypothetical protein